MPERVEPCLTPKIKGHGQLFHSYSCSWLDMVYSAAYFSFELPSVTRGHHVYLSTWTPSIGEILPLQVCVYV